VGASRIVFTGGDPVKRFDLSLLIRHAKEIGLEVALSTTGDAISPEFLVAVAPFLDLISVPLDGSNEATNARTKKPGHFKAVMRLLDWLRKYPEIDTKVGTAVTRHNLQDVPNILSLVEDYDRSTEARVFYNVFQTFPRAMLAVEWEALLVSGAEFAELRQQLADCSIKVNLLDHATLDRLYVMIFPDGTLVIPRGREFFDYGPFLEIADLPAVLTRSQFDSAKHLQHSHSWRKGS
jgi:MoaA/NifB/PqqE/SkfB family radical SAM enzyme